MKPCCENLENRADGPGPRGLPEGPAPHDVTITHCTVCECRHFEVEVDAGVLGLEGAAL